MPTITVIGAGIVGLCTALRLRQAGHVVSLVEAGEVAGACSAGNAGSLSSGSVAPLAMPGVLASAPGMLLDRNGPLHVPLSYLPQAAPWLLRFVRSATPERVAAAASALHGLLGQAVSEHQALAVEIGRPDLIIDNGQLHLYPSSAHLAKDAAGWALKRQHGLQLEAVGAQRIAELEPAVSAHYQTGYYLPGQPWVRDPRAYAEAIADYLRRLEVRVEPARVLRLYPQPGGWRMRTEAGELRASQVVIAAGAWSAQLLRPLGIRVPLQSQRGYHLRFARPGLSLSRIVVLADRKVFITPTAKGLQVAGTVEFAGLRRPPNHARAALLATHARAGLPGLDSCDAASWMGHRPCLPDSLPVIGAVPGQPGLWCAFGHGHLGLTGAPGTARLLAAAMQGRAPASLAPFSLERFGRFF